MSAVPRYPSDLGYAGLCMTADEYLALGETQERYELIHGVVVMSPSPLVRHNAIIARITQQLLAFADQSRAWVVLPETDVRFTANTVYRPDLVVYRAERLPHDAERLDTPPDLIVEVLSPSSKALDLITKRNDYERYGVGEYWVIDPETAHVRCWTRQGPRFIDAPVAGDSLASSAVPGFILPLEPIRAISQHPGRPF